MTNRIKRQLASLRSLLFVFGAQPLMWEPVLAQTLPVATSSPAPLFQIAGTTFNLDPSLLEAIARVESGGRADAVSPKGAAGLMQLMPATARRFGVSDPLNPVENVSGAARFLAYLRQDAQIQDLPELLAAYNAGEGAVARYGGIPPYEETREYVRRVLWAYLLSEPPSPVWHRPQVSRWQNLHPGRAVTLFSPTSSPISPLARSSRRGTDVNGAQIVRRTTTEIDVLDRLDQIRRARNRALKLQPQPRPIR